MNQINLDIRNKILDKIKNEGMRVVDASKEFDINPKTIRNWITPANSSNPGILEMSKLRRENNELKHIIGELTLSMERGKKNRRS